MILSDAFTTQTDCESEKLHISTVTTRFQIQTVVSFQIINLQYHSTLPALFLILISHGKMGGASKCGGMSTNCMMNLDM